jgi:hypothetical protein
MDASQLNEHLNSQELFNNLLMATKMLHLNGDADLTLPGLLTLLEQAKQGAICCDKSVFTTGNLTQLLITQDGTQKITAVNCSTVPESPVLGLGGMQEDLLVASALAQLARTKGKANHIFVMGLDNEHWVTVALVQSEDGVRSWEFMDSYNNQSEYKDRAIQKLECVLKQSESDLQQYICNAYNESLAGMIRRYCLFFNEETGQALSEKKDLGDHCLVDTKGYFVDNKCHMEHHALYIERAFQFMDTVGWLTSTHDEELLQVKRLYHLTDFMVKESSETHPIDRLVKSKLEPICRRLKETIARQNILNPQFCIREHFDLLFHSHLALRALPPRLGLVNQLVDERTLSLHLQQEYLGQDHVIMFYAHRPYSLAKSPYFPDQERAHTSVLLCKVNNNKIDQILNIDGYQSLAYVDVLGERAGATRHPRIQQKLLIQALGPLSHIKTPLQRASWGNMNCVLYSLSFVERLLALFEKRPEWMGHLFPTDSVSNVSSDDLFLLEEAILEGLIGTYVIKRGHDYVYDASLQMKHHAELREHLAKQYALICVSDHAIPEVPHMTHKVLVDKKTDEPCVSDASLSAQPLLLDVSPVIKTDQSFIAPPDISEAATTPLSPTPELDDKAVAAILEVLRPLGQHSASSKHQQRLMIAAEEVIQTAWKFYKKTQDNYYIQVIHQTRCVAMEPTKQNIQNYQQLQERADGKGSFGKIIAGMMLLFVGIALVVLAAVGAVMTLGASLPLTPLWMGAGLGVLSLGIGGVTAGACFFNAGRNKGLCRQMQRLRHELPCSSIQEPSPMTSL